MYPAEETFLSKKPVSFQEADYKKKGCHIRNSSDSLFGPFILIF
jgi:hypothetical protein